MTVAAAIVVWAALLATAPWLASHAPPGSLAFRAATTVYRAGGVVCHQRPERSFHAWGIALPVCARCAGLYASAAIGAAFAVFWLGRPARRRGPVGWRRLIILAVSPSIASVALELAGLWHQTPLIRSFLALPAGFVVAWFVAAHAGDVAGRLRT